MTWSDGDIIIEKKHGRPMYRARHRLTQEILSGWQGSPDQAFTTAERVREKQARKTTIRNCMRCRRPFKSEGPGHRLCSTRCRQDDGAPEPFSVATPSSGLVDSDA